MSRVNLLPSDIKRGQQVRRRTFLVIVGGAVVIGLIVLMWIYQGVRLSGVNDDIQAQNRTNAGLQQEINDLQKYEDLQVEAQQQQELLTAAYANEVAFSGVLVTSPR
jgi:Tfp pilus assembly protein PilN